MYLDFGMVILEPLVHRDSLCIAVRGKYDSQVSNVIRSIAVLKYSATHKCYYGKYSLELMNELTEAFGKVDDVIKDHWSGREMDETLRLHFVAENIRLPPSYSEHLIRRRYSKSTAANYQAQFKAFLGFIFPKGADEFTDEDIDAYQLYLIRDRHVGTSTQNQAINAIKFYLEQVKGGERREYYIERPRKECKLPTVLSEEEVAALLLHTNYIKHKCMLLLLYSAGLRISELLGLRPGDIDYDRKLINVRGGKGKKDRVTLLSNVATQFLVDYVELMKPKDFLFEGPGGKAYGATSVNKIIKRSAEKAGIRKNVSAHTLRHSFATHLLEHGTDLRYIQTLLGHENSKTTERYTQVTKKGFENLVSPLDRIAGKVGDNKEI